MMLFAENRKNFLEIECIMIYYRAEKCKLLIL
jgi:hypothetical protein